MRIQRETQMRNAHLLTKECEPNFWRRVGVERIS